MRKLVIHPAARAETREAAHFYNAQQPQLGRRFVCSVEEGAKRVRVDPLLYPVVADDVRRCLIRTFPYCILFLVKRTKIIVVAVMHLHRKPDYWKHRVEAGDPLRNNKTSREEGRL